MIAARCPLYADAGNKCLPAGVDIAAAFGLRLLKPGRTNQLNKVTGPADPFVC